MPFTYVYDPTGEKIRTVTFSGAGQLAPTSLFFGNDGRLLITPGCYIFDADAAIGAAGAVLRFGPTER